MFPPRVVLAAVDFSDGSRQALTVAALLAERSGAHLHVVHAVDPLLEAAAHSRGVDLCGEASADLGALTAALNGDHTPVTEHVTAGHAVDVICEIARRESADVIVVGATGASGPARVVFGSTAEGVVRKAGASVLVVRP